MRKPIRIGVAGAGVFGGHHCRKISENSQADLVGVYDLDASRARDLAGCCNTQAIDEFSTLIELADAVVIASPAVTHFELAREALLRGRHVLVEKPVASTVEEADTLIALAQTQGAILQVGHQERYVAAAAGLFGRARPPVKINCVRHTAASGRCEDVSVVLDLMIHDIDLIRTLTKADISSVTASGVAHSVEAELVLTNGTVAALTASRRAGAPERRMTLVYDDGVIEFDFVNRTAVNTTPAPLHADFDGEAAPLAFRDPLAFGSAEFIAAIAEQRPPSVTGEDGRGALDWALRIEDAAGSIETSQPDKNVADETVERLRA